MKFTWKKPLRTVSSGSMARIIRSSGAVALLTPFMLCLHPAIARAQAPVITNQPATTFVPSGGTTSLSVGVAGTGPFTYQWYFNGSQPIQSSIVDSNSIITTVAGSRFIGATGTGSDYGNGGPATNVFFNEPGSIAFDNKGNLFIGDINDNCVRKVDSNGIITTLAGTTNYGYSGDGGPATNAELSYPLAVAVDTAGDVFIADAFNQVIRKVNTNGIISTFAGNGFLAPPPQPGFLGGYSGDGGPATNAEMNNPHGVAVDQTGNVFIADSLNGRIRKVDANGIITTVAGPGTIGYYGDGGPATNAEVGNAEFISVDNVGNLFIAVAGGAIRKVGTNGIITTVAGNWTNGYSGDGGPATKAELNVPGRVVADAAGNLFISDSGDNRIRKVETNGIITTLAGTGFTGGTPTIVVSNEVNQGNFAASGDGGFNGDGITAFQTELNGPAGLALDNAGNMFIADACNNRIRKLSVVGSPLLTIPNAGPANTGSYSVVISNPYGSITSSVVSVTVILPPSVALALNNSTPNAGLTLNFVTTTNVSSRVYCTTNSSPPFQWVPIYTNLNGGSWQFTDTNTTGINAKYYRVSTP